MKLPRNPPHPGELLLEDFLKPLGMTQQALAQHVGVSFRRVNEIVRGKRAVSPEMAWLFAKAFGNSPQFWMSVQAAYDLVRHRVDRPVKRVTAAV
jgi:antitoxin HigA-1